MLSDPSFVNIIDISSNAIELISMSINDITSAIMNKSICMFIGVETPTTSILTSEIDNISGTIDTGIDYPMTNSRINVIIVDALTQRAISSYYSTTSISNNLVVYSPMSYTSSSTHRIERPKDQNNQMD